MPGYVVLLSTTEGSESDFGRNAMRSLSKRHASSTQGRSRGSLSKRAVTDQAVWISLLVYFNTPAVAAETRISRSICEDPRSDAMSGLEDLPQRAQVSVQWVLWLGKCVILVFLANSETESGCVYANVCLLGR